MVQLNILAGVAVSLLASLANAATCYQNGDRYNGECSISNLQGFAASICNGGVSGNFPCGGKVYSGVGWAQHMIHVEFQGSSGSRSHCWDAFNDIIGNCIQKNGQGGEWNWSYNGDNQNYYFQPYTQTG